jgi:hypothetical protein
MEKIDSGYWKPMRAGRNGLVISHLMFADCFCLVKLLCGKESRWAQVLLGKYGKGVALNEELVSGPTDSALWKAVVASGLFSNKIVNGLSETDKQLNFRKINGGTLQHSLCDIVEEISEDIIN